MLKRIIQLLFIALVIACNSPVNQKEVTSAADDQQNGHYGDKIDQANLITGNELVDLLQEEDSVWVSLKSKIVTNCQSSGCWMDLDLGNNKTVKVTFKDYAFFIPIDSEGKKATIEGFAKKEIISVDLLKHYAEDEGKSQEEIDAITESELAYTFEAIGVRIEE